MPIPGPRNQFGQAPGYTNPDSEQPDRFNQWGRPGPVIQPGRSPGTMMASLRGSILAPGTVRRLWRQAVNYIPAPAAYSWTDSRPAPGVPGSVPTHGYMLTTALRYLTRSVYVTSGSDNSRFGALHTKIVPRVRSKTVTIGAGTVRNRPTVRNRLTSFGSRVPTLNQPVSAAESADQ